MFGAEAIFPALLILLACGALTVAAVVVLICGLVCLVCKRGALGLILVIPSAGYLSLLMYLVIPTLKPPAEGPVSVGTIDLRQRDNLKMIFDGGLRPFRLQGLESQCCVFDKATVTVIVPRGSPFTMKVDRADIHVLANNQIDSIDLFGLDTSVPEAVALTKAICGAWNVPTTGLDNAIAHLGTVPDTGKGWGTEFNQPNIRAGVILKPLYPLVIFESVRAYVNVSFVIGNHFHGVKFLTDPIQPPPGYENVSMNPPPRVIAFPGIDRRIRVFEWGTAVLALGFITAVSFYIFRARRSG
jgi:hypothetical protein